MDCTYFLFFLIFFDRAAPPMSKDISPLLNDIARAIENDDQIESLGRVLGFTPAEIRRYIETNRMEGRVTARGTFQMLLDWRQKVNRNQQKQKLRIALRTAELMDILDEHLPELYLYNELCLW